MREIQWAQVTVSKQYGEHAQTAVHDHGRRLNQREFRPMAEVPFRPARQLSEYKGKGASASREISKTQPKTNC